MPYKLSDQDKEEIRQLRETGKSLREIGETFDISYEWVRRIVSSREKSPNERFYEKINFPNIREWCRAKNLSGQEMADSLGMSKAGLLGFLSGKSGGHRYTAEAIMGLTGLTYEEAFMTRDDGE